jgi:hypothetical protein
VRISPKLSELEVTVSLDSDVPDSRPSSSAHHHGMQSCQDPTCGLQIPRSLPLLPGSRDPKARRIPPTRITKPPTPLITPCFRWTCSVKICMIGLCNSTQVTLRSQSVTASDITRNNSNNVSTLTMPGRLKYNGADNQLHRRLYPEVDSIVVPLCSRRK